MTADKSNFFKDYWAVVLLTILVAVPRLFIQPKDWSDHVQHIIGRMILEEVPFLMVALILLSGLIYWFLEYLGYRFNFIVKTVHLVFTWSFLVVGAIRFYLIQVDNAGQTNDGSFSNVVVLFGNPVEELLRDMLPTAFVLLLCGQAIGIPHMLFVLIKGKEKMATEVPDMLDRLD